MSNITKFAWLFNFSLQVPGICSPPPTITRVGHGNQTPCADQGFAPPLQLSHHRESSRTLLVLSSFPSLPHLTRPINHQARTTLHCTQFACWRCHDPSNSTHPPLTDPRHPPLHHSPHTHPPRHHSPLTTTPAPDTNHRAPRRGQVLIRTSNWRKGHPPDRRSTLRLSRSSNRSSSPTSDIQDPAPCLGTGSTTEGQQQQPHSSCCHSFVAKVSLHSTLSHGLLRLHSAAAAPSWRRHQTHCFNHLPPPATSVLTFRITVRTLLNHHHRRVQAASGHLFSDGPTIT